jgi:long-chain acyl-CoA synthetase
METVTRIFDFPYYQLAKNNLSDCLVTKYQGQWKNTSTREFIDQANAISRALLKMGVKKNDKIALISSNNRTEWNVMDIGILQLGAQTIPIYPTITAEEYQYVLNHSESIYCFISDQEIFEKIRTVQSQVPTLKEVYSFDEIPGCKNWKELLQSGTDQSTQAEVEARKAEVLPSDLATIIYTSGTTGTPKGVMLTHNNVVSNVIDSTPRIPITEGNSRAMSFLPVCHIFERMLLYLYQYYSVSIYFAESIEKISDNLKEVKPHVMSVVPRLLEKVYDKIYAKGTELTGIKKSLFFWAVNLGLRWEPYGKNGWWYEKKLALARKLIFSKWKEALGGELEIMVSGSAA